VRLDRADEAEAENRVHERLILLDRAGALEVDPPLAEWQRAAVLASHHNLTGRYDLARVELDRSYALEPDNAEARVVEAVVLRDGEPLTMREAGFRHAG